MKIVFVKPNMFKGKSKDAMEPIVFALLKTLTPATAEVELLDERVEELPDEIEADIIAFSVDSFSARRAYILARKYKKENNYIVMGGYHVTFEPEEALNYCDTVFVGEAEKSWPQFITDFEAGSAKKIYRSSERSIITDIKFDDSIFKGKRYSPIIPVQFGRGCIYSCEYCSIAAFYGRGESFRCEKSVADEIERKGANYLFVTDDNFFQNREKAVKFCNTIKYLGCRWGCQISIDIAGDDILLKLMAESGCISVLIGFESLNRENLLKMKKSANISVNYSEAVKKINSFGIMVYGTFIFGYDSDSCDSFKYSLDFAVESRLFMANFNPLMVMPGTELYKRMKSDGRLLYEKWWLDDSYRYGDTMFMPKKMSPDELKEGCFDTRKKFNSISSIVARYFEKDSNMKNPFIYFGANLINRAEIYKKQGVKLGE